MRWRVVSEGDKFLVQRRPWWWPFWIDGLKMNNPESCWYPVRAVYDTREQAMNACGLKTPPTANRTEE